MARQATLKELNRRAAPQDRNEPALRLQDTRQPMPLPQTLKELVRLLGDHGQAAAECAQWAAIKVWLMKELPLISEPPIVAHTAVSLMRNRAMVATGLPHPEGYNLYDQFGGLSPESKQEAERVAARTLSDWVAAKSPWLGRDRIKKTYQQFIACIRASTKDNYDRI